jgi:hypothetical protein
MTWFAFERRWLLLIFAAILPASDDPRFPQGAIELGAGRYLDSLLRSAPSDFALGLRVCTWLVMFAPPFVLARWCTFAGLSAAQRAELLERLTDSDVYLIRELPMLFKTALCLGVCGLPDAQRRIGIHPVDASPPDWAQPEGAALHLPLVAERERERS